MGSHTHFRSPLTTQVCSNEVVAYDGFSGSTSVWIIVDNPCQIRSVLEWEIQSFVHPYFAVWVTKKPDYEVILDDIRQHFILTGVYHLLTL